MISEDGDHMPHRSSFIPQSSVNLDFLKAVGLLSEATTETPDADLNLSTTSSTTTAAKVAGIREEL